MKLYIVRHGETDWNKKRRIQGQVDIPLNDLGRSLARKTAKGLSGIPFEVCYTSPLGRAKETARLILEGRKTPILEDQRIIEMSFGDYEDKERKESLSMLLSALKNAQIDKREDLTEAEENTIIAKEIKQTKETMDTCPADRTDIIDECKARLAVLEEFAPEQMSEEQIEAEINAVLAELGIDAPTMKDKGKVMKNLMPRVKGKADGKLVNQLVGAKLS